jgi:hypothetical protein
MRSIKTGNALCLWLVGKTPNIIRRREMPSSKLIVDVGVSTEAVGVGVGDGVDFGALAFDFSSKSFVISAKGFSPSFFVALVLKRLSSLPIGVALKRSPAVRIEALFSFMSISPPTFATCVG